ncbi:MAG: hypothetical protein ACJ72K_04155 [Friedmanniella sp.]
MEQRPEEVPGGVRVYWWGLLLSLVLALRVVLSAIDVQSAMVPDSDGHAWPFHTLFGPSLGGGLHRQGWTVVLTPGELSPDGAARFAGLLHAHLLIDLIFIGVYSTLLVLAIRTVCPDGWWRRCSLGLLAVLVAADLLENALALAVMARPGLLRAVLVLTAVKWVAAALLAVVLALRILVADPAPGGRVRDRVLVPEARTAIRRGTKAVIHQRFSYAPVLVIFLLSVPSGAAILEQLPDAQREWVFDLGSGARHAVMSILATAVLSLFLLAVGRRRTRYAARHSRPEPGQQPELPVPAREGGLQQAVWFVGPVLALLGMALYATAQRSDLVLLWRTAVWVSVPVLIVALSWLLRRTWRRHPGWHRPDRPLQFDPAEVHAVGIAGNVAAIGAVVVGGLSLLRAFTPLVVLPAASYLPVGAEAAPVRAPVAWLLVLAVAAIIGPWLVVILGASQAGRRSQPPPAERSGFVARLLVAVDRRLPLPRLTRLANQYSAWLLLAAAILVFVGLGVFPRFAGWIGLSATATLALGSLAGMLSAVGMILQDHPTPELFRLLRFRRTPLVMLLAVTVVLVGVLGGRSGLHRVNPGTATSSVDLRPSLDAAFSSWLTRAGRCEVEVDGYRVRPMLLVAAEGGGIRAAYWTVRGLQAIDDSTCAGSSTFLSGGASGGSVGLTVARFSGAGGATGSRAAVAAVKDMARPETLSQAADGTFVRDLLYGATGIPVPRLDDGDPFGWVDRARLIETGWTASGTWGARPFLSDPATLSPSTGALVLNSTGVAGNCRVWLSQLKLPAPVQDTTPTFDPELDCDKARGVATRTIDLFRAYGPFVEHSSPRTCLGLVTAATGALLTARFPYVTPSGVVGPCPDRKVEPGRRSAPYWPQTQLVDGGYIENSGLATITDLAHLWLPLVRAQNDRALADRDRGTPLVVPVVVSLANGSRDTTQPALDASPVSEFAVPPATFLAAGSALNNDNAQLGRAQDAVALAGLCPTQLHPTVCSALDNRFPSRVVVVDRATQPEIGAPLGWVLSGASITSLDNAMAVQLRTFCDRNRPRGLPAPPPGQPFAQATCRPGFGTLGDLALAVSGRY